MEFILNPLFNKLLKNIPINFRKKEIKFSITTIHITVYHASTSLCKVTLLRAAHQESYTLHEKHNLY